MATKLPDDPRQVIEKEGGSLVHLVDAATDVHYALVRADQYKILCARFGRRLRLDASSIADLI